MQLFKKKEKQISRILVIRFSSIGDIVLTTPILRCIKRKYPDAHLHFLVKQHFRSVVEDNPHIDHLHTFQNDIIKTLDELQPFQFDCIIDLQKNFRSRRIRNGLNTKSYTFPKLNIQKWIYTNFKINVLPDESIVNRYFNAVEPLGVKNDGLGLEYFIPDEKKTIQEDIPLGHWVGFVGCVIGGSYFTKKFPVEKWKSVCSLIPYPIILLGGPEDKEAGDSIAQINAGKIYNACGKFNLTQSADLVQRSKVIVTNDTGLMHIAAAFKKPIISLWGNTTPWMGMYPYYGYNDLNHTIAPGSVIIQNDNLHCRPCSKIGYSQCPKKHFNCMNLLNENEIAKSVENLWNKAE